MSNIYNPSSRGSEVVTPGSGKTGSIASSDISRVLPRQLSTGTLRGTQNVGYGNVKIDGTNNRIVLGANDGSSVGIGTIPNDISGQVGFFATDTDGSLLYKVVNGTLYFYNKDSGINYMQIGVLPDGSTGMAVAKTGFSVDDAIT